MNCISVAGGLRPARTSGWRGLSGLAVLGLGLAGGLVAPAHARTNIDPAPSPRSSSRDSAPLRLRLASIERAAGEDPDLPMDFRNQYRGQTLEASYNVCVLSDGSVSSVRVWKGIAEIDDVVVRTLKTWRYAPQPQGTLTCTREIFSFEL